MMTYCNRLQLLHCNEVTETNPATHFPLSGFILLCLTLKARISTLCLQSIAKRADNARQTVADTVGIDLGGQPS